MSTLNVQSTKASNVEAYERAKAFFQRQRKEFIAEVAKEDPELAAKMEAADNRNSKEIYSGDPMGGG